METTITIANTLKIRTARDFNEALDQFRHSCETCLNGHCGKCCPMQLMFEMVSGKFAKDDPTVEKRVKDELAD